MAENVYCQTCKRDISGEDGVIVFDSDIFCSPKCLIQNLRNYEGLEEMKVEDYLKKFG